jgi:hypothetical protein
MAYYRSAAQIPASSRSPPVSRIVHAVTILVTCSSALLAQGRGAGAADRPVWPDEGPRKWPPRPTVREITANDLRTRLYQLADDSMSGRRVGELGNWKGTAYIANEFRRLGLKPAGDNGTYFQDLPYGPIGFDSATSRLSVGGRALTRRAEWIPVAPSAPLGIGAQSDLNAVATVYAGRWGDSTVTLDPATFRGKVAVFAGAPAQLAGGGGGRGGATPQRCDSLPDRFGARMAAYSDSVTLAGRGGRGVAAGGGRGGRGGAAGDSRLAAAQIAAVLFVGIESLPPATVNGAFNGRGSMQPASVPQGPGAAVISAEVAAQLFGRPVDQLTLGATGQPVTGTWNYEWKMSPTPARNVIAVLPGSDPARAAEYVLVGAHNDHVGTTAAGIDHDSTRAYNWVTRRQGANDPVCRPSAGQQRAIDSLIARARSIRPPRRDSIMNGADDDGSGTVVLLEIAERFASEKPARSIVFISHQGEESGLLGSRWFVDHPTIPLDKIVAAHNMDMVGKGRVDYVKFGGPSSVQTLGSRRLSREFGDIIDSVNATRGETMAIDKTWDVFENPMNRFCRSDQVNYVRKNVPVTYFSTGYAPDYHQVTDEPQYIEYDHSARIGRFLFDIMWAIAQRKDRPAIAGADPRYPGCGG